MEIKHRLNLEVDQLNTLDNHTVLNIFNVVVLELLLLSEKFREPSDMDPLIELLKEKVDRIVAGSFDIEYLKGLVSLKLEILTGVDELAVREKLLGETVYEKTYFNLKGVFEILEIRAHELIERKKDPLQWIKIRKNKVLENLTGFFDAIVRNAKERYRIVYDEEKKSDSDYLVTIRIENQEGDFIQMPAVFQDVIRDLAANSRKYTNVGGTISIDVIQQESELVLEVSDTGIGIQEEGIPSILGFGYRGSNVREKLTMGGGFGLTKAYYVTQLFKGRMWIDSNTNAPSGTTIRITLPTANA